jgi:non-ribosomal peptide synthase protein (TIGR01720 family)
MKDSQTVGFRLSEEQTAALQGSIHRLYNTEVRDLLLSALGISLWEQLGAEGVVAGMEGHGREEVLEGVNITRTVGWFTTFYPLLLPLRSEQQSDVGYVVAVKEGLRRVPNKGMGYGLLRYGRAHSALRGIGTDVTFNYLGDFGGGSSYSLGQEGVFGYSSGYRGQEQGEGFERESPVSVSALSAGGRLQVSVSYSREQYEESTIQGLADRYREVLLRLVEELGSEPGRSYVTPGDLTYKGLSVGEVFSLNSQGLLQDVYGLSPMQEGMYYHWLLDRGGSAYVEQVSYRLEGALDMGALQRSYAELVGGHGVLRTSFSHEYGQGPLQLVWREVDNGFHYEQWGGGEGAEQWVEQYREQDRRRGFDLGRGSQMRLSVLDLGVSVMSSSGAIIIF